ncbi:hypothetical protein CDAR_300581 [Caerostris darwini]|uniref:Uncharacterized protein n=1 Tax=Caerostris darwini TaxID=1538125 RepID=A0AAV4RT89_9ARAC|nr:hypothetical protein CDAR_300581 [Caerostris darwini]
MILSFCVALALAARIVKLTFFLTSQSENPLQDTPIVTQALADAGLSLLGDIVKFFSMSILVVIGYYIIYRVFPPSSRPLLHDRKRRIRTGLEQHSHASFQKVCHRSRNYK